MAKALISIGGDDEPSFIDEVTEILGKEVAHLMQKHFGGSPLRIPSAEKLKPEHPLVTVLGWGDAYKLCEEFNLVGVSIWLDYIPMAENSAYNSTAEWVRELLLEGELSARQIALKTNITRRAVFRIKAKLRSEGLLQGRVAKRCWFPAASRERCQSTPAQKANIKSKKSGGSGQ